MEKDNKNKKNQTGAYIAVCCCVLALGVTGYVSNRSKTKQSKDIVPGPTQEIAKITTLETAAPTTAPTPEPIPEPTQQIETIVSTVTSPDEIDVVEVGEPAEFYGDNVEASIVNNPDPTFILPVEGKIAEGFDASKPKYNDALGDWRTHNGVDILSDAGCEVLVSSDGVIKDIYEDYSGECVVVTHANGYESVYSALNVSDNIKTGQDIIQGDVLGTVSEHPKGENTKEPHVHFEIYKSGSPINPEDIFSDR